MAKNKSKRKKKRVNENAISGEKVYALISSISFFLLAVIRIVTLSENYARMRWGTLFFISLEMAVLLLLSLFVIRRSLNTMMLGLLFLVCVGQVYWVVADLSTGNPLVFMLNLLVLLGSISMSWIAYYASDKSEERRVALAVKYSTVPSILIFVAVAVCMLLVWYNQFLLQLFLYLGAYFSFGKVISYNIAD